MKLLKTGDPCPCCGQKIKTKDPATLYLLSWIQYHQMIPQLETVGEIYREFKEKCKEAGTHD